MNHNPYGFRQADIIGLHKAVLWEEAKGKLRAIVAADGAATYTGRMGEDELSFEKISKSVEAFIEEFEGMGYQE